MIPALTAPSVPLPLDLRKELPDPWVPWYINERLFQRMQAGEANALYKKAQVLPSDPEWRFIWRYFHHDKPIRYGIKRIYCVHERHQFRTFEYNLSAIEREAGEATFQPTWHKEPRAKQRAAVIERWKQITSVFAPFNTFETDGRRREWRATKVLPLWHGTNEGVCEGICRAGFTYFGKTSMGGDKVQNTDDGYFGSGIYLTNSARYAADIYSKGQLLLAWVSMREPFPVVGDPAQADMAALRGKGAYKHYNTHYIPVVPENFDPSCAVYYPSQEDETPICDEVVVFHKSQTLPRFWVELEVELPYLMSPSEAPLFVNELVPFLLKVLQHPQVDRDQRLRNRLNAELELLLTLAGDDYLEEKYILLFEQLTQLIDKSGKLNQAVQKLLAGAFNVPFQALPSTALHPLALPSAVVSSASVPLTLPPLSAVQSSLAPSPLFPKPVVPPKPSLAFGATEWAKYFGEVGLERPLPATIHTFLASPCPFWPEKTVGQTHLLVWIPEKVNSKPLTLNLLSELIQYPQSGGHATKYGYYLKQARHAFGNQGCTGHWVLMTRDVIPGSRTKSDDEQRQLVASYSQKTGQPYEVPTILEAAVSILMHHVHTGKYLYGNQPLTCTLCQERTAGPMFVGNFSSDGLIICSSNPYYAPRGVAAVQKFF